MPDREKPKIVAVVAMARNGIIGANGAMPWNLPSELRRFRRLTLDRPMIMGRKTLDSIGRVLDRRDTIVLTRSKTVPFDGAIVVADVEEALARAHECAAARGADEIVIAGGAEIYRQFLAFTDRIALTVVEAEPDGDTAFPSFQDENFVMVSREECPRDEADSARFRFELWERNAAR